MTSRFLYSVFAALVALSLTAAPALGHAELEESDPPDGGTITTPYTLTATFSEGFDPDPARSFIFVRNAAGEEVARGGVSDDDPTMMVIELPELEPGEYTARWQTVTEDDSGVEDGAFSFTVEAAATPSPAPTPAPATRAPTTAPVTAAPPTPAPTGTPEPAEPTTPSSNNDLLIALMVAGVALAGVLSYLYLRNRR